METVSRISVPRTVAAVALLPHSWESHSVSSRQHREDACCTICVVTSTSGWSSSSEIKEAGAAHGRVQCEAFQGCHASKVWGFILSV